MDRARRIASEGRLSSIFQQVRRLYCHPPYSPSPTAPNSQTTTHLQRSLSQPTHFSHPHLLSTADVTPKISRHEYIHRRQNLANALPPHSLTIFPSNPQMFMTEDVPYLYHPNTDLMYICGVTEPSSFLAALRLGSEADVLYTLFVPDRNPSRELWDGPSSGPAQDVADYFAVNDVRAIQHLHSYISSALPSLESFHFDSAINPTISALLSHLDASHQQALISRWRREVSPKSFLLPLRLIKSPAEQSLLREAANTISHALNDAMASSRATSDTGVHERTIEAVLEYECKKRGANRMSFPSVVASGLNGTILHYMRNDAIATPGQFVMVDAGCEVHGYCSDVSRSWPVSGRFSTPQKELYELVLQVQKTCISITKEDFIVDGAQMTLDHMHNIAARDLTDGLLQLGFLKGHSLESALATGAYSTYYPHATGHYLGKDVHDTHLVAKDIPLRKGMVVTVEPGLYCGMDDESAPPAFRGIGMRIEDDVVVGGPESDAKAEVLSSAAVKEIADVEAIIGSKPR